MFVFRPQFHMLILLLYFDDILLIGNNLVLFHSFVATLSIHFTVKDLGNLYYFLGIQDVHTSSGLFLSHHKHVIEVLRISFTHSILCAHSVLQGLCEV